MNKTFLRVIALLLLVSMLAVFAGCGNDQSGNTGTEGTQPSSVETTAPISAEVIDYAASVTLDMSSDTAKVEATVKTYVDGDTTHFYVDKSVDPTGTLKARYIAINTPESTGKIEEYGKAASRFTKEQLSKAVSIVLESDDANWNIDSTGSRYLVWIWYKTAEDEEYRNLNIEILQNGLAIASSSNNNRYGDVCMLAISQAKEQKLNVHSGQKDPDFYYGAAIELDLKELRTNIEDYNGMTVAFNGIVTKNNANTCYVEAYDSETDMYYGMTVYYGYGLSGTGLGILNVGNEVRIVGSVQYYETGGTWQVSDITYREMKPDDAGNIQCLSTDNPGSYRLTDPATFMKGQVEITDEEGETTSFSYGKLALSTSIAMENLTVVSAYTTQNEESSSYGAITLTCQAEDGTYVDVRTVVLYDENGDMVTQDAYIGHTINVKGIVDYYNGNYQVKVFDVTDIEIVG